MPKGKRMQQQPEQEIYVCCQCNGHFTSLTHFHKTYSGLFVGTGYLPICRDCSKKFLLEHKDKYRDFKKAVQRFCMAFDLYYSDKIFDSASNKFNDDEPDRFLGEYVRQLNMNQYRGKTFDDSITDGFSFSKFDRSIFKEEPEPVKEEQKEPIDPKDIEKWGDGFEKTDYDTLNSHYKYLHASNPNFDGNQEIFIRDLCYNKMKQMKALREDRIDDYSKLSESYRKTFTVSGLKITKEVNVNEDFTIGVNAETIEKYTPAEYYKNRKLYKDYDNIGDYISRFLLRPLRNLMHGTTDRDYEFYVKDGDDNADTDDE